MAQKGFTINGRKVDYDQAVGLAREGQLSYPPALLRAMFSNRTNTIPSPSVLSGGCLRSFYLKLDTDEYPTPESLLMAMVGTGIHFLLEHHTEKEDGTPELKMSVQFHFPELNPPWDKPTLSGTSDLIQIAGETVVDYKTKAGKKLVAEGDNILDPKHITQVEYYAAMLWKSEGIELKYYDICYIARDIDYDYDKQRMKDPYLVAAARFVGDLRPLPVIWDELTAKIRGYCESLSAGETPKVHSDYLVSKLKGRAEGNCFLCGVKDKCKKLYHEGR